MALTPVIQEAYIQGISTRSVDDLIQTMGMSGISKSKVLPLCTGPIRLSPPEGMTGAQAYRIAGKASYLGRGPQFRALLCQRTRFRIEFGRLFKTSQIGKIAGMNRIEDRAEHFGMCRFHKLHSLLDHGCGIHCIASPDISAT